MANKVDRIDGRDILAVVPAYRNPEALERCLGALGKQTISGRIASYVRDNSENNIYYTAAINEGLRFGLEHLNFRYFLVLTQDCYLLEDAVERLVDFVEQYSGVGIAAPVHLDPSNPEEAVWAGSEQSFPEGRGFRGLLSGLAIAGDTAWASGAAFLVRREVLVDVGVLDENMRFVCSDSDFSFSARSRGWQVAWVSAARCFHEPSDALLPKDDSLMQVIRQDMVYFADKWFTGRLFQSLEYHGQGLNLGALGRERDAMAALLAGD